jgi:hypothetical protein
MQACLSKQAYGLRFPQHCMKSFLKLRPQCSIFLEQRQQFIPALDSFGNR